MSRFAFGALALGLAALAPAADPAPSRPAPPALEFAVLGGDAVARLEVRAELDGAPVAALWAESFAKLFAYFDRNGDGALDATEVARLPAPRALRHALGSGFTPPVGTAPALADLDADKNGKVSPAELAAYYRANGIGGIQVGTGRLPASAALGAALLKHLDTNDDGRVSEKEWAAPDVLKKLDKNDDELIGAGELVPNAVYPGASGSLRLAPPTASDAPSEAAAQLPVVLLPTDAKDTAWAAELARRNPKLKDTDFATWRAKEPAARWAAKLTATGAAERFAYAGGTVRVEGWCAAGRVPEAVASARKQFTGQPDAPEPKGRGRGSATLDWLTPVADRDGDGALDSKELDAWLDLQAQIARGQLFLTVLDGGGLFELLDTNHDGALSVRELRAAWARLRAAGCTTDGAFDAKKLPRTVLVVASWGYPKSLSADARRGPAWFRAMDRNGDGDVSRREFTGPAEVFDKLDADKDGLLSAEEAEKAGPQK